MDKLIAGVLIAVTAIVMIPVFSSKSEDVAQPRQQTTEVPACVVDFLPYSDIMKAQILQLCGDGLSFSDALNSLLVVYKTPGVNPDTAAQIVRSERKLGPWRGAVADPDPWRKR